MSYINSVVDKVYVINLDKDVARLREIDSQLRSADIVYERFPAVLGSTLTTDPRLTGFCNEFCTDGIKGCALSHHTIWEEAIYHKYDSVMILEDDANVPSDINDKIRSLLTRIPADWDLIYVGCRYFCNDEYLSSQIGNRVLGTVPETHDDDIKKVKGSVGSHAIIFRTEFLKKIANEPISTHIDLELKGWVSKYGAKAYGLYPEIIPVADSHLESNLSETFPPLLTTALNRVEFGDSIPTGWFLSESFMKFGFINLNTLILLTFFMGIVLPVWGLYLISAWLLIELAAARDVKSWGKYMLFLLAGAGLKRGAVKLKV